MCVHVIWCMYVYPLEETSQDTDVDLFKPDSRGLYKQKISCGNQFIFIVNYKNGWLVTQHLLHTKFD